MSEQTTTASPLPRWQTAALGAIALLPVLLVLRYPGYNDGQRLLFVALVLISEAYVVGWWRCRAEFSPRTSPTVADYFTGFIVSLGDTLGIGSFAPTTAIFKLRRAVADEDIPGTLNVGLTPAAVLESFIFVTAVIVDPWLLTGMIASAALGAWLGAGVVGRLPRRTIQLAMGVALLIATVIFTLVNLKWLPGGGLAMGLSGWKFVLAVGLNFVFGALMSIGIGLYAPCMILLALLGMHPLAAFPIMTGSCGLLQPVASLRFFGNRRFAWGPALGLVIGCFPGILIAAYVIKTLDVTYLRWLVTVVVLYAAISMLRSAARDAQVARARALPGA